MAAWRILKGHPLAMQAYFEHVLVLTYAVPDIALRPLLPRGLLLDMYETYGFLAIAMVQTRNMRPRFVPGRMGRDFFLTGYRIFTRYRTASGKTLRGLRILRSDTDSDFMVRWGNRLTHYDYRRSDVEYGVNERLLEIKIQTADGEADLHVRAHLADEPAPLPAGSPFPNLQIARKFAGPLPFTFDYEAETDSIVRIQGVRQVWAPKTTRVEVLQNTFLAKEPFASARPILASAFHLADVPYQWKRGVREAVSA
ncbi:MAG TPA: DUF2071 domain-containing protein [Candidatus Acidoferrum sp.]|jgi:hypothetical protein